MGILHRLAVVGAAASAPLIFVTVFWAGVSNAVECGWGTVFDPPTNTCVAAPLPHRHLRRLRRRHGTAISRRTSRWVSARPFRSCRCAPAFKPGRQPPHPATIAELQRQLDTFVDEYNHRRLPAAPRHPATIYTADPKPDQSPPHGQGRYVDPLHSLSLSKLASRVQITMNASYTTPTPDKIPV